MTLNAPMRDHSVIIPNTSRDVSTSPEFLLMDTSSSSSSCSSPEYEALKDFCQFQQHEQLGQLPQGSFLRPPHSQEQLQQTSQFSYDSVQQNLIQSGCFNPEYNMQRHRQHQQQQQKQCT